MEKNETNNSEKIINQKEIRFVGLKRSGNHAIINWMLAQHTGKLLFINDVSPDSNPYRRIIGEDVHYINHPTRKFGVIRKKPQKIPRNCLLYSYEDENLKNIFSQYFEEKHDGWLGKGKARYDILILRDAFNFFACRLDLLYRNPKKACFKKGTNSFNGIVDDFKKLKFYWKTYAREYLGETNFLRHNKLAINYNRWFTSQKYRREIAKKLSFKFTDKDIDICAVSSSFEKTREGLTGAQKLKALERWKYFANDKFYRLIISDKELVELSNKIFGEIPGTERLYKKQDQILKSKE